MTTLTSKGSTTKTKILNAARDLLVKKGYDKLVLREVAKTCDIKLGNLQYYFPTVDDLVLAVIDVERQRDLVTVQKAIEKERDPAAALDKIIVELVSRWRSDAGSIYATLNLLSLHHDSYKELYDNIYANHYAELEALIAAAIPSLTKTECAKRARLVTALIDGSAYQTNVGTACKFFSAIIDTATNIALS